MDRVEGFTPSGVNADDARGMVADEYARMLRRWRAVDTVEGWADLTGQWLRGEAMFTPFHLGPADQGTCANLAVLARVNAAGMVTTRSQSAEHNDERMQRAYLTGFGDHALLSQIADAAVTAGLWVWMDRHPRTRFTPEAVTEVADHHGWKVTKLATPRTRNADFPEWARVLSASGRATYEAAAHLTVADPEWGRGSLLWDVVVNGAEGTPPPAVAPVENVRHLRAVARA